MVCFVVHKTTSELEHAILTIMFLPVQKTPTVGALGRGICSILFPLYVSMFSSFAITVAAVDSLLTNPFTLETSSSSPTTSAI
jgi:hypothetical protein